MVRRAAPTPRRPRAAPARPRRTRLDLDVRRAQLLAMGRREFAARAYDDVSIDAIARAAGISKGLLYHYYPTKRDLYVAGLRETAAELVASVTAAAATGTPIERVRAGLDAFLDHVSGQATPYVALMRGGVGSDPEIAAVINATRADLIAHMVQRVDTTPLAGAATAPLFRIALHGWFGMVEAASLDYCANRDCDRAAVRELLVRGLEAMLAGLAPVLRSKAAR